MKRVLLLLCKGVELFEAAAFHDVLGWSGNEGAEPVEVITAGRTAEVSCTFGHSLPADMTFDAVEPDDFDALALPGGFADYGFYDDAYSDEVAELVRAFHKSAKPVAAICVGALALGHSGILKGKEATTYHLGDGHRRKELAAFGANVLDRPLVSDANICTSSCPSTAVDVALWLLGQLTGEDNAADVRKLMGFDD